MPIANDNEGDNGLLRLHQAPEQFQACARLVKASNILTGRQRDVFRLVGEGYDTKTIARRLGLAPSTVKVHLSAVYRTLDVVSASQVMALLVKAGDGMNAVRWKQNLRSGQYMAGMTA